MKTTQLQTFGVWHKDYMDSESQFFPRENQFLGYFYAENKEQVLGVLLRKGVKIQDWVIEPKPYDFGVLRWTLLDLALIF